MHTELSEFLITAEGRHISKRYTESAFVNNKKHHLVGFVKDATKNWPDDIGFGLRCWAVLRKCTDLPSCRTCKKTVLTKTEHGWDKYCDRACASKDPELSTLMIGRRKKVDEKAAAQKRAVTMTEKFGVEFASQRESHKEALRKKSATTRIEVFPQLEDRDWMYDQHITQGKMVTEIADDIGVYYGTVIDALNRLNIEYIPSQGGSNVSGAENDLACFIEGLGFEVVRSSRKLIGKELDIFVPEKNIAFEYNGLYWHSMDNAPSKIYPSYHRDKTNLCNQAGIRLIHINENEWLQQRNLVESMVCHALGVSPRKVGARKCTVVSVDTKTRKSFFDENHISGDSQASISIGLEYEGELLCCISMRKPRFSNEATWEIVRFASKQGWSVQGGFGRVLKEFRKTNNGSIMSYCDLMKGTGAVYRSAGFVHVRDTQIGYYWTDKVNLFYRTQFMKHLLKDKLKNFDATKTEAENMFDHGWRKFYDCGNSVWILS